MKFKNLIFIFISLNLNLIHAKYYHANFEEIEEDRNSGLSIDEKKEQTQFQLKRIRNFEAAKSSVIRLEKPSGSCTATLISKEGYVLTNAHCLSDCINQNKGLKNFVNIFKTPDYSITTYSRDILKNKIYCEGYYNFTHKNIFVEDTPPLLVWVGKGHSNFNDEKIVDFNPKVIDSLKSNKVDVAILKFKMRPNSMSCLKILKNSKLNEHWTIGYPDFTTRNDGFDSNGYSAFFNNGTFISSILNDAYIKTLNLNSRFYNLQAKIHDQSFILKSNIEAHVGSSGSPILDLDSNILGIVYGVVKLQSDKYLGASTLVLKIDKIIEDIEQDLGPQQTREIFNCN